MGIFNKLDTSSIIVPEAQVHTKQKYYIWLTYFRSGEADEKKARWVLKKKKTIKLLKLLEATPLLWWPQVRDSFKISTNSVYKIIYQQFAN